MKKRTFSLHEEQIAALEKHAEQTDRKISKIVSRAIDLYLKATKRKRTPKF